MNDILESILVIYFMGLMLSITGAYLAFSNLWAMADWKGHRS